MYRLVSWFGQKIIAAVEYVLRKYTPRVWQEPAWAAHLCLNAEKFRTEFLALYDENLREFSRISPEQKRITQGNSWKVFILRAYGRPLRQNCLLCPATAALCEEIPQISSLMFSVLEPGTEITPHRGPYAGVLRCLIPIIVPAGDCGIRVGDTRYRLEPGRPLVFDDTLEHEAWNRTAGRRVVLFIDFLRPLPTTLAVLNQLFVRLIGWSPFIGRMLRRSL